ncbi:DUF4190 domain-containing protein [Paractinoplanes globisporus]|uniref:DUF4190 domain-containing protein n=1 Tax=Paractinoplanes globisporus TaxID=113565 RepID=A0ABW6WSE1_9ACTN|nr:DUF4190 domain-containing protein [Actinoplanes globisporus]
MNCTNCGAALSAPTGYCGTCGQPTSSPTASPSWTSDANQFAAVPHAEPYAPPPAPSYAPPPVPAPASSPYLQSEGSPASYGQPLAPAPPPYAQPAYGQPVPPAGPPQLYGPPPIQPYPAPGQPYGNGQPYNAQPYENGQQYGPGQPHQFPSGPPPSQAGIRLSIVSFVLSIIGVMVLPIVFGVGGIVCGVLAFRRGERLGKFAMIVAIVATAIGLLLAFYLGAALRG